MQQLGRWNTAVSRLAGPVIPAAAKCGNNKNGRGETVQLQNGEGVRQEVTKAVIERKGNRSGRIPYCIQRHYRHSGLGEKSHLFTEHLWPYRDD
jgi:hypothetical protein